VDREEKQPETISFYGMNKSNYPPDLHDNKRAAIPVITKGGGLFLQSSIKKNTLLTNMNGHS
jgi:hypothetical protein